MVSSSQITDMLFSALTYHALRGCLYHTGTRSNETRKAGGKEKKRRKCHRLTQAVGLKSDNSSHKMRNTFTHHPKILPQKSYPPKDGRSDLKHQTCPQTDSHRASWAKLPLAGRHLSLSHPSSKVSYKSGAVSQSCGFLSESLSTVRDSLPLLDNTRTI